MLHSLKWLFLLLICSIAGYAQHPAAVEQNLKKAGDNRQELEKAIAYCKKTKDPLKLKAIYFLIANMDIHYAADYYWEGKDGKKIIYNELDYPDFDEASKAFEIVRIQNEGLHPRAFIGYDLESIKGDFLIDNLEKAFLNWKNSPIPNISFENFCEYLLPYRISIEPLQKWRTSYNIKFSWLDEKIKTNGLESSLYYVKDDAMSWFTNTWGIGGRKEPLPRLGSQQLLMRKQGPCADLADLGVFTLRSAGVPATINLIPFWATSTDGHVINTFFDANFKPITFDYDAPEYNQKLKREPAKVLRITYSKQPQALPNYETQNNIPQGFLRDSNFIDVTQEYWQTTTVKSALYPTDSKIKTAYIATFNGLQWRAFWWGKIKNNESQWDKICVGTVILPQYYLNEELIAAASPIVVGEKENRILTPDMKKIQPLTITSAPGYLLIKPNVIYKLFYWDKKWELIDSLTAIDTTKDLTYQKVPDNALLLLVASDSRGFERPFVVNDKGERTWY